MAEPMKNQLNIELLKPIVTFIKQANSNFDAEKFIALVFDDHWKNLELKQRYRKISESFKKTLPNDYATAVELLGKASQAFTGFETLFFPDFIEAYGWQQKQHFDVSMKAIETMTASSSAEFAIRPFIKKYPLQTFQQLQQWAVSDNEHLRRLASEGTRPKLPWASQLKELAQDPTPNILILELLKKDPSKYVQKSVANHLNDISKDHPERVLKICSKWQGSSPQTNWIIKHACRTLLKQAHPQALRLFGYSNADDIKVTEFTLEPQVIIGGKLHFSFKLSSPHLFGKTRIEYAIHFMKSNGKTNKKIFKISEADYPVNEKEISKNYSFKNITTRKYYLGKHQLEVIINGQSKACRDFLLI